MPLLFLKNTSRPVMPLLFLKNTSRPVMPLLFHKNEPRLITQPKHALGGEGVVGGKGVGFFFNTEEKKEDKRAQRLALGCF